VRGGELVVVAHHLVGRRYLKGQWLEISNIFLLGGEEENS
jgi:hypothetical protein